MIDLRMYNPLTVIIRGKGYYVLVGVPTETEKKAFDEYYGSSSQVRAVKGLEALVVNFAEPAHIQRVVQRVEDLKTQLGRDLAAVILNNWLGTRFVP